MAEQVTLDPAAAARADDPDWDNERDGLTHEAAADIAYQRLLLVNVLFFGPSGAGDRGWVLIDAGLSGTAGAIAGAADERFGKDARPAAIVMTHGHFDHAGTLASLAQRWDAPVYAHALELPYLDGRSAYPPPDPTVGGGLMAALSPLYPHGPFDVGNRLHALPQDGSVPGMPGWRWLHTPGHTPGHVSLWREADRSLLVGDAFITTHQESAYDVVAQKSALHGPPMYYTPDWPAARDSVRRLAALAPERAVTGHGRAMHGLALRAALETLAREFDQIAVPKQDRYVAESARAGETGTRYVPPAAGAGARRGMLAEGTAAADGGAVGSGAPGAGESIAGGAIGEDNTEQRYDPGP